jgi:predicted nuclease of predicted toxin-antitoxin system
VKFLIDNQLPRALTVYLRQHGHDAVHVRECGLDCAEDAEVAAHARSEGRVLISKDEDFRIISDYRGWPQLVWLQMGNCRNAELLSVFDRHLEYICLALGTGQRIIVIA